MAGTRRRTRVDDSPAHTSFHQRSVSHLTSAVEESASGAEIPKTIEIAESSDEASPGSESPFSRSTTGFCKSCGSNIGEYLNSWHKVTNSYYVPTLLGSYKSLLKPTGRQKVATNENAIAGCTIQPLSCAAAGCTDPPIGFVVVDAPAGRRNLRGREFFKLSRIELRCEIAGNESKIVQPREDPSPGLIFSQKSESPPPFAARTPSDPPPQSMVLETRPSPSQAHGLDHRGYPYERHEVSEQIEAKIQPFPLSSVMQASSGVVPHSALPQKASSAPHMEAPAVKSTHASSHDNSPSIGGAPTDHTINGESERFRVPEVPLVTSHVPSPGERHYSNGKSYPRSPDQVTLSAIDRIQTQVTQNTGALAAHTRDIRLGEETFRQLEATIRKEVAAQIQRQMMDMQRVDEAVARLHLELHGMRQVMEGFGRELAITRAEQQRGTTIVQEKGPSAQDSALELMAQQMELMSQKTNEVDALKVRVEILRNRVSRIEDGDVPPRVQQQGLHSKAHPYESPRDSTQRSHHQTPTSQATLDVSHTSTASQPLPNQYTSQQSHDWPSSATAPEAVHRLEPTASQGNGWATVNGGTKRPFTNEEASSHEAVPHVVGSPKRQKAAADSQASYTPTQDYALQHSYERTDIDKTEPLLQASQSTLPSQHQIFESIPSHTQPLIYSRYEGLFGTQDGPSDDSWRPESQRMMESRPRGRPRGGGPGSRGGRVRKSMPAPIHQLGTPDWERDDWQGVPESQTGPGGYYNHLAPSGRGIARRGNGGGGGRGGYTHSERAMSLGSQGVSPGMDFGSPNDQFGFSKKSRSKPIRNADGVLIRKDGRPDMRSQSSAMNLRKIHLRKEGDLSQGSPTGFTPTNLHHSNSAETPGTPTPNGDSHLDEPVTSSAQKKHNVIIGKMFPKGIGESRKQHDYAHQVFEQDSEQNAAHRIQHLQHTQGSRAAVQIKKEQLERSILTLDSPNDLDVDMDGAEDSHAGGGVHIAGEQSETYHNAQTQVLPQEVPQDQPQERQQDHEVRVVPETQGVESSATIGPESMPAT